MKRLFATLEIIMEWVDKEKKWNNQHTEKEKLIKELTEKNFNLTNQFFNH
jgi:hypothetical protein